LATDFVINLFLTPTEQWSVKAEAVTIKKFANDLAFTVLLHDHPIRSIELSGWVSLAIQRAFASTFLGSNSLLSGSPPWPFFDFALPLLEEASSSSEFLSSSVLPWSTFYLVEYCLTVSSTG